MEGQDAGPFTPLWPYGSQGLPFADRFPLSVLRAMKGTLPLMVGDGSSVRSSLWPNRDLCVVRR